MSGSPTHNMVNGVMIPLTPAEISVYQAQWVANPPNLIPPIPQPTISQLQTTIDNLATQLATIQALPSIQAAATAASVTLTPVAKS